MPVKPTDLNAAIASLISDQIAASLAPYTEILQRMTTLLGNAPAAREPSRREGKRRTRTRTARRARMATEPETAVAPVADVASPPAEGKPRRTRRTSETAEDGNPAASSPAPVNVDVGQVVWYRQGRGAFEAKVVECVDGVLTLERLSDAKRVQRPAGKVVAASIDF